MRVTSALGVTVSSIARRAEQGAGRQRRWPSLEDDRRTVEQPPQRFDLRVVAEDADLPARPACLVEDAPQVVALDEQLGQSLGGPVDERAGLAR